MTRTVIVWGASSGAGKSLVATALCRIAARRGIDVAPFKAQNMSNHARVVAMGDGESPCEFGEIGAAQWLQARAARIAPTVDMNPVLLKPETDTSSQVVVHGRVVDPWSAMPWRERAARLAGPARESFERLRARHDCIVVEGAGSPAEINLAAHDFVNLGCARWARDAGPLVGLVVADIDRGGAFAHLHGTWSLMPDDLRPAIAGFVLNKFRGDPALLAPGPEALAAATGVPVVAVLPMRRDHGLPDEDGLFDDPPRERRTRDATIATVAIVAYPRASNLDEFAPLRAVPGVRVAWARRAADLDGADWIVLPGSKRVRDDLTWLRAAGLDGAIARHAAVGTRVLGICGGLQMLGARLDDPDGRDGDAGRADGLGLLPLATRYAADKRLATTRMRFDGIDAPWSALDGVEAEAYEIRRGIVESDGSARVVARDADGEAAGWQRGSVLGVHAHGLFESSAVVRALFSESAASCVRTRTRTLDDVFDGLADLVESRTTPGLLDRWLGG